MTAPAPVVLEMPGIDFHPGDRVAYVDGHPFPLAAARPGLTRPGREWDEWQLEFVFESGISLTLYAGDEPATISAHLGLHHRDIPPGRIDPVWPARLRRDVVIPAPRLVWLTYDDTMARFPDQSTWIDCEPWWLAELLRRLSDATIDPEALTRTLAWADAHPAEVLAR
jgi:hypothetical protein